MVLPLDAQKRQHKFVGRSDTSFLVAPLPKAPLVPTAVGVLEHRGDVARGIQGHVRGLPLRAPAGSGGAAAGSRGAARVVAAHSYLPHARVADSKVHAVAPENKWGGERGGAKDEKYKRREKKKVSEERLGGLNVRDIPGYRKCTSKW